MCVRIKKSIDQYIVDVIKKKHPKTVHELTKLVQQEYPSVPEKEILRRISNLENHRIITLKKHQTPGIPALRDYIFSIDASWYWVIIILAVTTVALVFTMPENLIPFLYVRYVLGSIFVLFLPGYAFLKALFPEKEPDSIERTVLSIGISLALVPLTGLILNYTPWGIRTTPVILSLLALTTILATVAVIRVHRNKTNHAPNEK